MISKPSAAIAGKAGSPAPRYLYLISSLRDSYVDRGRLITCYGETRRDGDIRQFVKDLKKLNRGVAPRFQFDIDPGKGDEPAVLHLAIECPAFYPSKAFERLIEREWAKSSWAETIVQCVVKEGGMDQSFFPE